MNEYLQLQLYDLLFQFSHFGLFSVSGCLSCHSVLQFPDGHKGDMGGRGGGGGEEKGINTSP